jgi:hypothetical protein
MAQLPCSGQRHKLTLSGDGGGVYDLDSHDGTVTLTVTRVTTAGPPAAQVTDALAGRAQTAALLSHLPASTHAALSHLADFFNTPAEQRPARTLADQNPATRSRPALPQPNRTDRPRTRTL